MPRSDRHSTPRQIDLISDHPSIFMWGINLRPKNPENNHAGETPHNQKPPFHIIKTQLADRKHYVIGK
jgi:hypothetical protein